MTKRTLEEMLELQRMKVLNDFVINVRDVEHLGMKVTLCETLSGSTKVFDHNRYELIGSYCGIDLYMKKDKNFYRKTQIEGNTIHNDTEGTYGAI